MTKDRRLGRGLAALLGSPLEEETAIGETQASATATRAAAPTAGSRPTARPTSSAAGSVTRTATDASASSAKSVASNPTPSAPRNTGVTGAVPLSNRPANRDTANRESASEDAGIREANRKAEVSSPRASDPTSHKTERSSEHLGGGLLELSVYEIDNNPFQPRRKFNEEEVASLAESIREHQQLQPILVRKIGDRYQLISGERRLRATIHAGLKTIRAEVREADDRLVAELAIVENLQRKDLDPIEKAMSFRRYIDEHQCKQDDLAKRLKIDRSTIANLMRLLELPLPIQESIQSDRLTAGHARALLPLGEEHQQLEFARQIKEEGWSVRETERRVAEQIALEDGAIAGSVTKPNARKKPSPQIVALEQELRLALGTKTEIKQSASGRGKIAITFANNEEFERICALICPDGKKRTA